MRVYGFIREKTWLYLSPVFVNIIKYNHKNLVMSPNNSANSSGATTGNTLLPK